MGKCTLLFNYPIPFGPCLGLVPLVARCSSVLFPWICSVSPSCLLATVLLKSGTIQESIYGISQFQNGNPRWNQSQYLQTKSWGHDDSILIIHIEPMAMTEALWYPLPIPLQNKAYWLHAERSNAVRTRSPLEDDQCFRVWVQGSGRQRKE